MVQLTTSLRRFSASIVKPTSLILLTLLLATFLRFYRLDAQSFWNDEGNSARLAERSFDLIIAGAAGDIHPPGYYFLLAAWRAVAGQSEFVLRGLSAFAGIILVAIIYRLGRQYFSAAAALSAAFFAAIHPALIYYSQEARMYSLVALCGAALFLAVTHQPRGKPPQPVNTQGSVAIVALTVAGLYTHYTFAFIIIAINLLVMGRLFYYAISQTNRIGYVLHFLLQWVAFQFMALLFFIPWLPIAYRQVTTWPSAADSLPLGQVFLGVARWLTFGPTAADTPLVVSGLVGGGGLLVLALLRWRGGGRQLAPAQLAPVQLGRVQLAPPLLWLILPVGLTVGFGLFSPAFAKFLIIAVPGLCLLLGHGAIGLFLRPEDYRQARVSVGLTAICVLAIIAATSVSLWQLYFDPTQARADYRGLARYIDSIAQPGDAVLLNAPNQWEVFTYYHPDDANVFPVARSRPLEVAAQILELQDIAAKHQRLFALFWGDTQADPNRVIETWLNDHTFKAYDQWYGDVRLAVYAVPQTAGELHTRTDATFGAQIVLEGYALNADSFSPGDILRLTLFWHTRAPLTTRYKVFVHLNGEPGAPPAAQHDGEPGGGLGLTTTWQIGQTIADNHGVDLPLDLSPGQYTLTVGLYNVDDGSRLLLAGGGDALPLSTVTVR